LTPRYRYPISPAKAKLQGFPISETNESRANGRQTTIALAPARDVELTGRRMVARSDEPWLRFVDLTPFRAAGFVEITYRASIFDDPVRPILRFRRRDGTQVDRFLPGPIAGAAMWVGRVPTDTTDIWISPTRHRGRFDFLVESIRPRNWLALWLEALARSPRYGLSAAFYGVPRFVAEYDMNLDWALGFTSFSQFDTWRQNRARPLDFVGIDAPRTDWMKAPRIHVFVAGAGERQAAQQSLATQLYPNWRLHDSAAFPRDARDEDLAFMLSAKDRLEPYAFACVIEHAARHPEQGLFYSDEIEPQYDGTLRPLFKPDWSPLLQAGSAYIGRAVFGRVGFLRGEGLIPSDLRSSMRAPETFPSHRIGHLRRMLLTRGASEPEFADVKPVLMSVEPSAEVPDVCIIIPTKDRGDLLENCVASTFANTRGSAYHVVVVDNGTTETASRTVLERLAQDSRVTVLSRPGPFNFAALCNAGADARREPILVFLNDDTSVRSPDWLEKLSRAAARPDIGAVGAKLLYPDHRVQHAGISVGIGETAGHFGAGLPERAPGWLARHLAAHEVSAVTAACLAVERRKFDAVNGFDAEHLPIELNDVDLCLRLGEQGWKTVCLSDISLFHHESASRGGAKFRLLKVHHAERAHFLNKWRAKIRDDPFFHPGLSLFRRDQALG
jgi:O-antigen biosynthesis protein